MFGTLNNGLVALRNDSIDVYLNKEQGLIDNTIWGITIDSQNNIFLALDNGISYVTLNSPIRLYNDKFGLKGTVLAVEKFNEILYVGTTFGLFKQVSTSNFEMVDNINGYVWHLLIVENHLYASTYSGLLRIDENQHIVKLAGDQYLWNLTPLSKH